MQLSSIQFHLITTTILLLSREVRSLHLAMQVQLDLSPFCINHRAFMRANGWKIVVVAGRRDFVKKRVWGYAGLCTVLTHGLGKPLLGAVAWWQEKQQ